MELHFSQHFGIDAQALRHYGAFDISVVSDLPLFIDPFLLFNSDKPDYVTLHASILKYLCYLRDIATDDLDHARIKNLYRFKEVKQNWLGFTMLGNGGSGLGDVFARALHESLGSILKGFGTETITQSSHLEKVCLIKGGVGRDNVSDFTTNLIKDYLCEYTETFARDHMDPKRCADFAVSRARFNYDTETWETRHYLLPQLNGDYVLLTPADMLTRSETWINHGDMIGRFSHLPDAVEDDQLRAQINHYFKQQLGRRPSKGEKDRAAAKTIRQFPELVDWYIKLKEEDGDRAEAISADRVSEADTVFVRQLQDLVADLLERTDFYQRPTSSYTEALERAKFFKHYVENQDGYRLINKKGGKFSKETDVQLFFGMAWFRTQFDVNREPNNGRGPVDFKISKGAINKSLIEFKLASNSQLKRNLEKQVEIYKAANQTPHAVKVIICYTAQHIAKVAKILKQLKVEDENSIVVVDARRDNKPSASKA